MLKDLMYTTLGAGMMAREKFEKDIEAMKSKGKESRQKAKQMQEELEQKGKEEEIRLKAQIKDIVKEVVDELNLATKDDIAGKK